MNKSLTTAIGILAIFIFAQAGIVALTAIESQASPVVSVEPAYQTVSKGENCTVSIYVDPKGSEVYGASYHLYFNNTLLNATAQTKGPFLGENTLEIPNEFNNSFNSTHGIAKYGETRILPDTTGVTQPGVLANITFQAIAEENGVSELWLDRVKLYDPDGYKIENVTLDHGTIEIAQPSSPFLIDGYVFYENDSECNNPVVHITNLNTGEEWKAETHESSNYYQLVLSSRIDINASETLQFNVTSPDGKQSNITNCTVTQDDIDNGGLFEFNITLGVRPGVFDTGAPANPYPSISGVHNGTLIPDRVIEANRIYTYPCAGTGGHTEYVRIWGNGVDAHANWSGYAGDWHNLTFNTSFTLEPGKKYHYTIITGSYPQIIHAHSGEHSATGGKIKCDEFSDANGVVRENWIPAFRLWRQVE